MLIGACNGWCARFASPGPAHENPPPVPDSEEHEVSFLGRYNDVDMNLSHLPSLASTNAATTVPSRAVDITAGYLVLIYVLSALLCPNWGIRLVIKGSEQQPPTGSACQTAVDYLAKLGKKQRGKFMGSVALNHNMTVSATRQGIICAAASASHLDHFSRILRGPMPPHTRRMLCAT